MAKYFRKRSSEDIIAFLEAHGYKWTNTKGDDDIFTLEGCHFTVKVTKGRGITPIGTMHYICRMAAKCGIEKKKWLEWWKRNGHGD